MKEEVISITIPEILDEGVNVFCASLKTCLPTLSFVLLTGLLLSHITNTFDLSIPIKIREFEWKVPLLPFISNVFFLVLLGKSIHHTLEAKPFTFLEIFFFSLRKTIPYVCLLLITFGPPIAAFLLFLFSTQYLPLQTLLWFLPLSIPLIYFSLNLSLSLTLLVGDEEGLFSSLALSHKMMKDRWWKTATVLGIPPLLAIPFLAFFIFMTSFETAILQNNNSFSSITLKIWELLSLQCFLSIYYVTSHHWRKAYFLKR